MFSKYVRDDYSNSILDSLLKDDFICENFLGGTRSTPHEGEDGRLDDRGPIQLQLRQFDLF